MTTQTLPKPAIIETEDLDTINNKTKTCNSCIYLFGTGHQKERFFCDAHYSYFNNAVEAARNCCEYIEADYESLGGN